MSVLQLLVAVTALANCLVTAYVPSGPSGEASDTEPKPEFFIHFPKTTEIGCYNGKQPPSGGRGVFFMLDRMLSDDHTCKFLTYNARDYRGDTDAYRFRRLVHMYPDIVRPDRTLQCDTESSSLEETGGTEFEMSRNGVTKKCRMVAEPTSRSDVAQLELIEGYKRLPGGVLLLRAWYDLPLSRRYVRSPGPADINAAAREHDRAAAAKARFDAANRNKKLQWRPDRW